MRTTPANLIATLAMAGLFAACSSSAPTSAPSLSRPAVPAPTSSSGPAPQGPLSSDLLRPMLLQLSDLPALANRREFASADLTTQVTPQLALCSQESAATPHELANVLAKPDVPGQVQVFEVLSAYTGAAAARQAFDQAALNTAACRSYSVAGVPYKVVDVARPLVVGAAATLQYRLTTPSVVSGDVRTLAVKGRFLVLVTGYGAPPAGQSLLSYQAGVMAKALARVRR